MIIGTEKIHIVRQKAGEWSKGEWILGPAEISLAEGTVLPSPGEVLSIEPGGDSQNDTRLILTYECLRTGDDNDGYSGDYVVYKGEVFRVISVRYFPVIIPHYEAKAVRLRGDAAAEIMATI